MRYFNQPVKIIDDFFEFYTLYKNLALDEEYITTEHIFPGNISKPINEINENIFHNFAKKIINHLNGKQEFHHLYACFNYITESNDDTCIKNYYPNFDVSGIIFLNSNENDDIVFYNSIDSNFTPSITIKMKENRCIFFSPKEYFKIHNSFMPNENDKLVILRFFGQVT